MYAAIFVIGFVSLIRGLYVPQQLAQLQSATTSEALAMSNEDKKTIWGGTWGSWKGKRGLNRGGYYACGAELRFEDSCGGCDDTAGNGLRLVYCSFLNWGKQETVDIHGGTWGSWKGKKMCPSGAYVDGAQVRFEDSCGGCDDTALNGLKIHCTNPTSKAKSWVTVHGGTWGGWKHVTEVPDKYATAAESRFEDSCGGCDDSAMNGINMWFAPLSMGTSKAQVRGFWSNEGSGARVYTEITESTTTTDGTETTEESSFGFSQSITAGFEFDAFVGTASAEVSVGAEQSFTTASAMSQTLEKSKSVAVRANCPQEDSPTGMWVMWQWNMDQKADANGRGFSAKSPHIRCTQGFHLPPKCPLGWCKDIHCQTCRSAAVQASLLEVNQGDLNDTATEYEEIEQPEDSADFALLEMTAEQDDSERNPAWEQTMKEKGCALNPSLPFC